MRLLRFCAVGVLNTAVSLTTIWSSMYFLGLSAVASNAAGYAVGIGISFVVNRRWTFGDAGAGLDGFGKWLAVCGAGYAANVAVLVVLEAAGADGYAAQVPAMIVYTAVTFLGSRLYVFNQDAA